MAEQQYWAACQTMPGREHAIRAEIEKMDRGAFLPTFARTWVGSGKLSAGEKPLLPGYVFFRTGRQNWADVQDLYGVQQVLTMGDEQKRAKPVADKEMVRLVLDHATGEHNDLNVMPVGERRARNSSRKPRPGKRIRERKTTVR